MKKATYLHHRWRMFKILTKKAVACSAVTCCHVSGTLQPKLGSYVRSRLAHPAYNCASKAKNITLHRSKNV